MIRKDHIPNRGYMRTLIIHNPKSGFGSDAIFEFMRDVNHPHDECVFRVLGDGLEAPHILRDAEEFDVVVLSGGDKTIASLLAHCIGRSIRICIFPSGTNNLFFTNLGCAAEPGALARACRTGHTESIDLMEVTFYDTDGMHKHISGFMAGTGWDAEIMRAAVPNRQVMGQAAYIAAALANPLPKMETFTITVDGTTYTRQGICCMVANCAMIQDNLDIAPDCVMNDGKIEALIVETTNPTQLIKPLFASLFDPRGTLIGRPKIECLSGVDIRIDSTVPISMQIDGDFLSDTTHSYSVRVIPQAVNLICDQMSPYYAPSEHDPHFGQSQILAYPKE